MKKQDGHENLARNDYFSLNRVRRSEETYQIEIQLGNMVAHFFGTFPFTQTDLAENQLEDRLTPPLQHSQNTRLSETSQLGRTHSYIYKDYMHLQTEDKGLIVSCTWPWAWPISVFF